jgi:hypothetical protein
MFHVYPPKDDDVRMYTYVLFLLVSETRRVKINTLCKIRFLKCCYLSVIAIINRQMDTMVSVYRFFQFQEQIRNNVIVRKY